MATSLLDRILNRRLFLSTICIAISLVSMVASAASLEQQRDVFRDLYGKAELGIWQPTAEQLALLQGYVLWPDLRAAYYRATLSRNARSDADIRQFLDKHGTLKPARELRYRYSLQLASEDRMPEYLAIYRQFYQGLDIAKLDCIALHAELLGGATDRIVNRAQYLWLVGKSQAEECDPVFDFLRSTDQLGRQLHEQRFELAIAAKQFSLARYVARSLDAQFVEEATAWLESQNNPAGFVRDRASRSDTSVHRRQLTYAVERLAYSDPVLAAELWASVLADYSLDASRIAATDRHIALWAARTHQPDAYKALVGLPAATRDSEVLRWQTRSNLLAQEWPLVVTSIEAMEPEQRAEEDWQYWYAQALGQLARDEEAVSLYEQIAADRNYYGFLAADAIGAPYSFSNIAIVADETALASLSNSTALVRARELYFTGLEGRGRSEWDDAVKNFNAANKLQAALLAHRWGWHSRAIATAASIGHYDDLDIRYPLPFKQAFSTHSSAALVRPSWAYGVARSESLFMRDVRSSAGAIGLMQLMPATGKETAQHLNHPYQGRITLTDPASNIRLGTFYLGQMYSRFDSNMAMATAAYNAGPHRVDAWRPPNGSLDARIWIENIPYNETRGYVRRVLETDVIFHWRLTGNIRRISTSLASVPAAERVATTE